jgi:hypothetical protein
VILFCRLLDSLQSFYNRKRKQISARKKWGAGWQDKTRSGRRYSRVEFIDSTDADSEGVYALRAEPGWFWFCQNCKTPSLITESMMPAILKDWSELAKKTVDRGYRPPVKPTAATAGCTNCKYLPGAPE